MDSLLAIAAGQSHVLTWSDRLELGTRLRSIAHRRAALDAEEARLLRVADKFQTWKLEAYVSQLDYMERELGYLPHTASERLRVARALGHLPAIEEALARGALCYGAVRELSRVAIADTEVAWRDAAAGKNLRQIEDLVAGHRPGDRPEDPPEPELRRRHLTFVIEPEAYALYRQVRATLSGEHGLRLDDSELVTALCNAALEAHKPGEPSGRAKYQIALSVCPRCDAASQEGGGKSIPISEAALERARCDSQDIGSVDGDTPARATQAVPPATYRFVWARDKGRCRSPGCRSARGLEVHHLVHRADGGGNEPSNLVVLCSRCHANLHAGTLVLRGTVDHLEASRCFSLHQLWRAGWDDDAVDSSPGGDRELEPSPGGLEPPDPFVWELESMPNAGRGVPSRRQR